MDAPEEMIKRLKGQGMPQTPEAFYYLAELYEQAMIKMKEENSRLRARINDLEQRLMK